MTFGSDKFFAKLGTRSGKDAVLYVVDLLTVFGLHESHRLSLDGVTMMHDNHAVLCAQRFSGRYGFREKQLREELGARIKRMKVASPIATQSLLANEICLPQNNFVRCDILILISVTQRRS